MSTGGDGKSGEVASAAPLARKPYERPTLRVYGNLARITEAVNFKGNKDGKLLFGFIPLRTGG